MNPDNYVIEIATTDFESTKAAVAGGAYRIELCSALSEGGLTPSAGQIKLCRTSFNTALFPIIRPRSGDFLYSEDEYAIMEHDALLCKELDCDGIVIGFLNNDGSIDVDRTAAIVEKVYPLDVTFHRAFDRCSDPFEALEELIQAGCQRVLTSGQQLTAPEGAELIRQLIVQAASRIIVMPGSGVRAQNIAQLAQQTGAVEFHSSLKTSMQSQMDFKQPAFAKSAESYTHPGVAADDVLQLRRALQGAS